VAERHGFRLAFAALVTAFAAVIAVGATLHGRLRATTRNGRLQTLLLNFHDQAHLIRHVAGQAGDRPTATLEEHRIVVDAIARRDGDAAAAAMAAHLITARANALAQVSPPAAAS
jgi:DNA-binding GntR family transcriptional regulator